MHCNFKSNGYRFFWTVCLVIIIEKIVLKYYYSILLAIVDVIQLLKIKNC